MNANETPPIINARLDRIQKVSKCFRLFLQFGFPLIMLAAMLQAVLKGIHAKPLDLSQGFDGVFIVKSAICLLWGIFALAVGLVWYWTSLKLFRFFETGILFTTETARCFKIIGFTVFAGIIGLISIYFLNPLPDQPWPQAGAIMDIFNGIFTGAFWIFLGWLFEEAQKMREEQELTV